MSDLDPFTKEAKLRFRRLRSIMFATWPRRIAVAVIVLVGIAGFVMSVVGGNDSRQDDQDVQADDNVIVESIEPTFELVPPNYPEEFAPCPDGTILDDGPDSSDTCISLEEYQRREQVEWEARRQEIIAENDTLQAAINDLQVRFNAEPELSKKLSVLMTTFCHSDRKYQLFHEVPADYEHSLPGDHIPISPDVDSYEVYPYDSSQEWGDFGQTAASLWVSNWDAAAVDWRAPIDFDRAAVAMCNGGVAYYSDDYYNSYDYGPGEYEYERPNAFSSVSPTVEEIAPR